MYLLTYITLFPDSEQSMRMARILIELDSIAGIIEYSKDYRLKKYPVFVLMVFFLSFDHDVVGNTL